jgi:[ribosomal protein S18]-alanine N-acetyltransferase
VIKIRKFQPNDMFPVIKLASETLTENYNPSIFNYFYETYPQGFIVAEKHHKIIGFIVGLPLNNQTAKILMLSIIESQRRQNIGSELLKQLIAETILNNIKKIELEVRTDNNKAIKFYQKHGFKIIDKINKFYQNQEDAYTMRKTI